MPFALILCLCLILAACGSDPASGEGPSDRTEPAEETAAVQSENTPSTRKQPADPSEQQEKATEHERTDADAMDTEDQSDSGSNETREPTDTDNKEAGELSGTGNTEPAYRKVLVAYFSATGTTRGVAEQIANVTDADLYEIIPAEPYSEADLNYNDSNSRATKEQKDKNTRPVIASETIDLSSYSTIYIGFPIWWGGEPRIMDTFVESYDFSGITLIPFCTSGSSGIGASGTNLEALSGTGTWLPGARHDGNISEAELQAWIEGLK